MTRETTEISGQVAINRSDQPTLLDAVHEQGVEWPYECRQGYCGKCKAFLIKGRIETVQPVRVVLPPRAILLCSSVVAGDCDGVVVRRRPGR